MRKRKDRNGETAITSVSIPKALRDEAYSKGFNMSALYTRFLQEFLGQSERDETPAALRRAEMAAKEFKQEYYAARGLLKSEGNEHMLPEDLLEFCKRRFEKKTIKEMK